MTSSCFSTSISDRLSRTIWHVRNGVGGRYFLLAARKKQENTTNYRYKTSHANDDVGR